MVIRKSFFFSLNTRITREKSNYDGQFCSKLQNGLSKKDTNRILIKF